MYSQALEGCLRPTSEEHIGRKFVNLGRPASHSCSKEFGMNLSFLLQKIGCAILHSRFGFQKLGMRFSFLFPFPKFGNGPSHSQSLSQKSKSHPLSPLGWVVVCKADGTPPPSEGNLPPNVLNTRVLIHFFVLFRVSLLLLISFVLILEVLPPTIMSPSDRLYAQSLFPLSVVGSLWESVYLCSRDYTEWLATGVYIYTQDRVNPPPPHQSF